MKREKDALIRATWSAPQAAKALGIGEGAMYNAIHRGEVRTFKLGDRIFVPKSEVDRLLACRPVAG
jgi:excisionase family DNA binding protein